MGIKSNTFEIIDGKNPSSLLNFTDNSCLIDLGLRFVELSPAWEKMLGRPNDEFINRHILEFTHPEDRETTVNELKKISKSRFKVVQFEIRILHKNGDYIPTLWSGTFDPSQQLIFILVKDISTLTNKKAPSGKEKDLERLINKLPALIGYWDPELKNIYCNSIYSEYFGKTPSEIKGMHIKDVLGAELYKKNEPYILRVLNGEPQNFDREIPLKNGTSKFVYANYIPDIIEGKLAGFFIIASDITELRISQNEKQDLEEKLITASKMSSLGEMAGGLAHEINNPLAIIIGKNEQLKDQIGLEFPSKMKLKEISEKIELTVSRISKIVKDLNTFAGRIENEIFSTHNVPEIINETCDFFTEYFRSKGIELRVHLCSDQLSIECRSHQLKEVLLNLLNNAHDAIINASERYIQIELADLGEQIEISILDSGPGISTELKEKIFRPFFTTKEIGKGTGLGLSTAKGIIDAHKGSIWIDNKSKNTKFLIRLPKKQKINTQDKK